MKNKFTKLITLVSTLTTLWAQAQQPNFEWAKSFAGDAGSLGKSITTDVLGNVYTTGDYKGTIDLDPGPGTTTVYTDPNNGDDIYVTKMDANGNLIWAKSIGGSSTEEVYSVVVDASGNVFVTGRFYSSDFNPGSNSFTLSSNGSDDMFICKFNASGTIQWARSFGSTGFDAAFGLAVDGSGNCYFTGYFSGTVDFNPGAAVYNLTSVGSNDIFLYKMDASGNLIWVNSFGNNANSSGSEVTLDAAGNVYLCGGFSNILDFDPGPGTATLNAALGGALFVAKYTSSGAYVWARAFNGNSGYKTIRGITVDVNNNVFTTGSFNVAIDFDPGVSVYSLTPSGIDIYVSKLDNNGNFAWVKSFGSPNQDYGMDLSTDAAGNVYSTGFFAGIVDFDPGPGTYTFTSTSVEAFVNKLDASGNFVFAYTFGDIHFDQPYSISLNAGNIHLTGGFSGVVDFNPGAGTHTLSTSPNVYDTFIHKMSQCFAPATPSNLTLPSNTKACSGSTLALMAMSGTATTNWYSSAASSLAIASGTLFISSSTLAPGTYTYFAEAQSCTVSAVRTAITFTIFANPVLSVAAVNSVICTGETTSLTVGGAATYSWSNGPLTPVIVISPTITSTYSVIGIDTNNCSATSVITQSVSECTGIESLLLNADIRIYPNPNQGVFTIELNENVRLSIRNILGDMVFEQELNAGGSTIDISNFDNGIYIVSASVNGKQKITRLIKN